jgi:hypothetical protein
MAKSVANYKNQYEGGRASYNPQIFPDDPEKTFQSKRDSNGNFSTNISQMIKNNIDTTSKKGFYCVSDQPEQDQTIFDTHGPYVTGQEKMFERYDVNIPLTAKLIIDGTYVVYLEPALSTLIRGNWFSAAND